MTVTSTDGAPRTLSLRVPGWAVGARLEVGERVEAVTPGTVQFTRAFVPGELVVLGLPVAPRFTFPDGRIDAVRGCVAVERGPEMLCLESPDLPTGVGGEDVFADIAAGLRERSGRVHVVLRRIEHEDRAWPYVGAIADGDAGPGGEMISCALVPNHDWAERGPSTMQVWLPVAVLGA